MPFHSGPIPHATHRFITPSRRTIQRFRLLLSWGTSVCRNLARTCSSERIGFGSLECQASRRAIGSTTPSRSASRLHGDSFRCTSRRRAGREPRRRWPRRHMLRERPPHPIPSPPVAHPSADRTASASSGLWRATLQGARRSHAASTLLSRVLQNVALHATRVLTPPDMAITRAPEVRRLTALWPR